MLKLWKSHANNSSVSRNFARNYRLIKEIVMENMRYYEKIKKIGPDIYIYGATETWGKQLTVT